MACNGPDGSKWATDGCMASSAQTSCSESTAETCYYAFCLDGFGKIAWFSGKFAAGSGLKIHEPAALADTGIGPGDFINKINGIVLSDEATLEAALAAYTEANPASVYTATHLLGKFQLTLTHP